jgi:hypothetical protein
MKEVSNYDKAVKELFQHERPAFLLDLLTGGMRVRQTLNAEAGRFIERRADLVFLLEDESILHLEFQTRNAKDKPYRVGMYCLLLGQRYRRRVRQVVIYIGQAKMRMENQLDLGQTKIEYSLMDIRAIDAATLKASGRPANLALAMPARNGTDRLTEILERAARLKERERDQADVEHNRHYS